MRRCWLSGAVWLGFCAACTQSNPAFELAMRASSGDTEEERDSAADGDESGKTGASVGGTGDGDGTSGRDTEREGESESGGTTDEGEGSDETGDHPEGAPCSIADCGPKLYCSFPEGSACGHEDEVGGVCKERPLQCPPDLDPVLACDCQTWFDNPCRARQAGFDVACRDGEDECVC